MGVCAAQVFVPPPSDVSLQWADWPNEPRPDLYTLHLAHSVWRRTLVAEFGDSEYCGVVDTCLMGVEVRKSIGWPTEWLQVCHSCEAVVILSSKDVAVHYGEVTPGPKHLAALDVPGLILFVTLWSMPGYLVVLLVRFAGCLRRTWRVRRSLCEQCAYLLLGLSSGRSPECGSCIAR